MGKKGPDKYTVEWVRNEVTSLLEDLNNNPSYVYVGELFEKKDYSRKRFGEWYHMGDEIISGTIDTIRDILESRVIAGAIRKDYDTGMVKFHLINNYDWKDKTETDVNQKLSGSLNLDTLPDDNEYKKFLNEKNKKKK